MKQITVDRFHALFVALGVGFLTGCEPGSSAPSDPLEPSSALSATSLGVGGAASPEPGGTAGTPPGSAPGLSPDFLQRPGSTARPDLFLITVDALRADHLPWHGYRRNTAPFLSLAARDAVLFEGAHSHASETMTSVPAILSGRFPAGRVWEEIPEGRGLAEQLQRSGYRTGAFLGNAWLREERGYARGFDLFRNRPYVYASEAPQVSRKIPRVDGSVLLAEAAAFVRSAGAPPVFVWIHLMDVHNPYQPPAPFLGRFFPRVGRDRYVNGPAPAGTRVRDVAYMGARYDEGILYADHLLKRLWGTLDARRQKRPQAVILTSDHGEEMMDHGGFGHGTSLHREQIHVPLVVWLPGRSFAGRRIPGPVGLMDVTPTLWALAGLKDFETEGRDLRERIAPVQGAGPDALAQVGGVPGSRWIPARQRSILDRTEWASAIGGPWQLLRRSGGVDRVIRIGEPASQEGSGAERSVSGAELTAWEAALPTREEPSMLSGEARGKLEALGYVERP